MKSKEELNFIGYYYQEPMMLDGDPLDLFKYAEENAEVRDFLKVCSIEDFIWVIINLFKDKYANGSQLSAHITASNWKEDNGVLEDNIKTYIEKPLYRNDIDDITIIYDLEEFVPTREHMISFGFNILEPLDDINIVVEEILGNNNFIREGDKYILDENSAIKHLVVRPDYFLLKINESKIVYF